MISPSLLRDVGWRPPEVEEALALLAKAGGDQRGAVFTRREVVEFILDLVDYRVGQGLVRKALLEPSIGDGGFLLVAIERLLDDAQADGVDPATLQDRIRGVELHAATFEAVRAAAVTLLSQRGLDRVAIGLADAWLVRDDFLLTERVDGPFDVVVGNPPYVRQELIPSALLAAYRAGYPTLYDRADLYVPFIERGLRLLRAGGRLGFICSDRWMKNRYGGPLRRLVAEQGYRLRAYVDMVDTPAFQSEVIAYPAITVIERSPAMPGHVTRVVRRPDVSQASFQRLTSALDGAAADERVSELVDIACRDAPWLLDAGGAMVVARRLERTFPLLEESGCTVGIGVATGCDRAFIAPYDELPVEESRKLPLVMARDLQAGRVVWSGAGVLNPFDDTGRVVDLASYPRFAAWITRHEAAIRGRNVAKRNPTGWYRTIDRITPALRTTPKLLIPDIAGEPNVTLDEGRYYPHHNLYWLTSEHWELPALQVVLRSAVARLFVRLYSVEMRGGFLRYQAQYLRRIRLPAWDSVAPPLRTRLREIAVSLRQDEVDEVVAQVYGLTDAERQQLLG